MKDEIKTVSGYGRIFPKERDTDESVIFLKPKNLVKQAFRAYQLKSLSNSTRLSKSGKTWVLPYFIHIEREEPRSMS
ncbi:hypothetical protein P5673_016697 [Acropora cervicornis]|uniref:Uncharacterized protein n=1 Tax=Acropora cervicornis TaxID=6130 RepID=A0AAD9QFJ7_ACRCE|nr:hypothetical protein P5673_016697 [Acropora cervicornis]